MNFITYKEHAPVNRDQVIYFYRERHSVKFVTSSNTMVWDLDTEDEAKYVFNELRIRTEIIRNYKE